MGAGVVLRLILSFQKKNVKKTAVFSKQCKSQIIRPASETQGFSNTGVFLQSLGAKLSAGSPQWFIHMKYVSAENCAGLLIGRESDST